MKTRAISLSTIFAALACGSGAAVAAEPMSIAVEAHVQRDALDRLIDARAESGGESAAIELEIAGAARDLETLARQASDSITRLDLLEQAALGYFAAAVPLQSDAPDSRLRLAPGPVWKDYERLAWEIVTSASDGINRLSVAQILFPALAFDGEVRRVGAVYGAEYGRLALAAFRLSRDEPVRICAGAYAAQRIILGDWGEACRLSREVMALETQAEIDSEEDARAVWRAIDGMATCFEQELWRTESDVRRALDLYAARVGDYPTADALADGERLWENLRPYLAEAVSQGPWSWREPDWMDLASNRLLTVPGLEIVAVQTAPAPDGGEKPLIVTALRLWDDWSPDGSSLPPWTVRREGRLAAARSRSGRVD